MKSRTQNLRVATKSRPVWAREREYDHNGAQ